MRTLRALLLSTGVLAAVAFAGPASADDQKAPPPLPLRTTLSPISPLTLDLAVPRENVASMGPLGRLPTFARWGYRDGGSARPMRTVGWVIFGLGLATMFGAGVTAIVAGASAADLEDECPGKVCVEGTSGEREFNRARDAARAADWLIGIGMPIVASGTVMLIYSAVLERNAATVRPVPVFRASPTGVDMTVHF